MLDRVRRRKNVIPFAIVLLFSLWVYSLYFKNLSFGDEYDNFVYSWLFVNGNLPYRDYFTHHYPLLVFLGSPLALFGHSKDLFRFFVMLATFLPFFYYYFHLKGLWRWSMLLFLPVASFGISTYSGQQFADSTFLSIFILSAFLLILASGGKKLGKIAIFIFSLLSFLCVIISPQYLLPFIMLAVYHNYCFYKKSHKLDFNFIKFSLLWLNLFLLLLLIYLAATNSLSSFYYDALIFNGTIYYRHIYEPYISFRPLDFYLHTSYDVFNHFRELVKFQGDAFLLFLKSAKFIFWPFAIKAGFYTYFRTIFTDFYNNFFTFEILIALFYLLGVIALIFKKSFSLATFSVIFIFGIRLRLLERIHMAPYYLFAFWLFSAAVVIFANNLILKKRVFLSVILLILCLLTGGIFITKNWYDFNQAAFNRFANPNDYTVKILNKYSTSEDKIMVLSGFSASYYWDSQRQPYGYFPNFFPWYNESPRLRERLSQDLQSYDGNFLIIENKPWNDYCAGKKVDQWLGDYLPFINTNYELYTYRIEDGQAGYQAKNLIFKRKKTIEPMSYQCVPVTSYQDQ